MKRYELRHRLAQIAEGRHFLRGVMDSLQTATVRSGDLAHLPADHYKGGEIAFYDGTARGQARRIYAFTPQAATPPTYAEAQPYKAFSPAPTAADPFEVHPQFGWSVEQFNEAIAAAVRSMDGAFLLPVEDESVVTVTDQCEYTIADGLRYLYKVSKAPLLTGHTYPLATAQINPAPLGFGRGVGVQAIVGQSFRVPRPLRVRAVKVFLRGEESGLDAGLEGIASLSTVNVVPPNYPNGVPGTDICRKSGATALGAAAVSTDGGWVEFTFPEPPTLAAGVQYFFSISLSPAYAEASTNLEWYGRTETSGPGVFEYGHAVAVSAVDGDYHELPGQALVFELVYDDNYSHHDVVPAGKWGVIPGLRLLHVDKLDPDLRLRLWGLRDPLVPEGDEDEIETPEGYTVAKAAAILFGMQPGGSIHEEQDRMRWVQHWEGIAGMELMQSRTAFPPDCVEVGA